MRTPAASARRAGREQLERRDGVAESLDGLGTCHEHGWLGGSVAISVGIDWRVFVRHEAIRSCGEVNDLIVWFLGEGLPSVDLAHGDLSSGEQRPEQPGGGLRGG